MAFDCFGKKVLSINYIWRSRYTSKCLIKPSLNSNEINQTILRPSLPVLFAGVTAACTIADLRHLFYEKQIAVYCIDRFYRSKNGLLQTMPGYRFQAIQYKPGFGAIL